jgi:hypothetical protein
MQPNGKNYFWVLLGIGLMFFLVAIGIGGCEALSSRSSGGSEHQTSNLAVEGSSPSGNANNK